MALYAGVDRPNLSFSDGQDGLVPAVAAAQPYTIVAMVNPGAVLTPWSSEVQVSFAAYVTIGANVCFEVLLAVGFYLVLIWESKSPSFLHIQAVIAICMPGQEEGHALADVLFGAVDPGGRLPVTFPNIGNEVWCELVRDYSVPLPVCALLSCYLHRSLCSVAASGALSVRLTLLNYRSTSLKHSTRHPRRQPAQHVLHREA